MVNYNVTKLINVQEDRQENNSLTSAEILQKGLYIVFFLFAVAILYGVAGGKTKIKK
jgi:hypothetical protein